MTNPQAVLIAAAINSTNGTHWTADLEEMLEWLYNKDKEMFLKFREEIKEN